MCLDSVWTQSTKHSYMYLRVLLWMTRRDRTGISSWEASKVAAHSFLDLQSKAEALTVNRKETIVWKNYWKYFSCSPCIVEALFAVWRALVTVWSCCTNSEYIYISVMWCAFLSWGACVKTIEVCWQSEVCKESTSLDISLLYSLCSVSNVSVDNEQR